MTEGRCPECGAIGESIGMCVPSQCDQLICPNCGFQWNLDWPKEFVSQQGELKKFIQMFEATSVNHLNPVIAQALYRKLDQARQEFPFPNSVVMDEEETVAYRKAFLKWFGVDKK